MPKHFRQLRTQKAIFWQLRTPNAIFWQSKTPKQFLGFWDLGRGTRLWRPKEPSLEAQGTQGGRFLKEPRLSPSRHKPPITLESSKNPFRQSLIGEKPWKRRVPQSPWAPYYQFLQVLKMGFMSFKKHDMHSLYWSIRLKESLPLSLSPSTRSNQQSDSHLCDLSLGCASDQPRVLNNSISYR